MNELYLYPSNDYRYYLAHHGVPGMKWGVRRYQNYDGSLTAAGRKHVSSDGQGFKARMKIRGQNFINTQKDIINSTKAAKGVVNKASELVGHGRAETVHRNQMYAQARLKNASKTRLGKHYHDVKAYNEKQRADLHSIKRGQSVGRRIGEFIVPVTAYKMPMKTITGRKTTVGMETLATFIGGPYGRLALAGGYYASKGIRSNMDAHHDVRAKESSANAKASYDKSMSKQAGNKSKKKN
jgi:hypothetical protein